MMTMGDNSRVRVNETVRRRGVTTEGGLRAASSALGGLPWSWSWNAGQEMCSRDEMLRVKALPVILLVAMAVAP